MAKPEASNLAPGACARSVGGHRAGSIVAGSHRAVAVRSDRPEGSGRRPAEGRSRLARRAPSGRLP